MGEPDSLIEVLKEIRDEIRALRTELGDRGARMAASGIRTEVVERGGPLADRGDGRSRRDGAGGAAARAPHWRTAVPDDRRDGAPTGDGSDDQSDDDRDDDNAGVGAWAHGAARTCADRGAGGLSPGGEDSAAGPDAQATCDQAGRTAAGSAGGGHSPQAAGQTGCRAQSPHSRCVRRGRGDGVPSAAAARARPPDVVRPDRLGTGEALACSPLALATGARRLALAD